MPASPLLLLVPYRYKATVLYSQIPTSASASGDMVVSRSGVSTRINAQGNIEPVSANVPRLNYPLGGIANGCPALLIEPSAINIHTQSEAFDQNYTAIATTLSGTNLTAPDNTSTADRYFENAVVSTHVVGLAGGGAGFDVTSGTIYTISAFIKGIGGRNARFSVTNAGSGNVLYTLSGNGSVSNSSIGAIQYFGNDWYRCSLTFTATGNTKFRQNILIVSGSTDTFEGDPTKGIILWGAQLETGSVATSYIPTTTAAVTRNADIVTNNTFVIPNLVGAIFTEFDSPTSGTYFLDNIPIPIASGSNKIAISYTPTTLTIYRNGAQVSGSPTSPPGGTAPIIGNVINIGHNNQLYQLGSGIKSFVLYTSTLTAAEASGLTS